jgi:hypothetical protein
MRIPSSAHGIGSVTDEPFDRQGSESGESWVGLSNQTREGAIGSEMDLSNKMKSENIGSLIDLSDQTRNQIFGSEMDLSDGTKSEGVGSLTGLSDRMKNESFGDWESEMECGKQLVDGDVDVDWGVFLEGCQARQVVRSTY